VQGDPLQRISRSLSRVHTLRGVDAEDLIVCDEMAYMDPKVIFDVVLPLLEVDSAVIIGISTPVSDQYNFFERLINLNHPGTNDPIFASVKVELVCEPCKRKKNLDGCRHRMWMLPSWKGSEKFELAKIIYEGVDQEETRQRESLGMAITGQNAVFDKDVVEAFANRPPMTNLLDSMTPTHLFMMVDPNGGSTGDTHSHLAIVTMANICGSVVVSANVYVSTILVVQEGRTALVSCLPAWAPRRWQCIAHEQNSQSCRRPCFALCTPRRTPARATGGNSP
jgi:hypothetical protein